MPDVCDIFAAQVSSLDKHLKFQRYPMSAVALNTLLLRFFFSCPHLHGNPQPTPSLCDPEMNRCSNADFRRPCSVADGSDQVTWSHCDLEELDLKLSVVALTLHQLSARQFYYGFLFNRVLQTSREVITVKLTKQGKQKCSVSGLPRRGEEKKGGICHQGFYLFLDANTNFYFHLDMS